jgi:hypothetical protein
MPRIAGIEEAAAAGECGSSARCIGMGYGKTAALRDVWLASVDRKAKTLPPVPFITTDCEVNDPAVRQCACAVCLVIASGNIFCQGIDC